MNRVWIAANAVLTIVLVVCIGVCFFVSSEPDSVQAGSRPTALAAKDLHLRADAASRLLIGFATPVVADEEIGGEPRDFGLRLEPANPVLGTWLDTQTLALSTARPLRRATRHTLHFGEPIAARDGRVLAAGSQVELTTASVELRRVVVEGSDAAAEDAFVLGFDMPVREGSLREKLEVTHAGTRVPVEITALQPAEENAFRVRLKSSGDFDVVHVCVHRGLRPQSGDIPMTRDFRHTVVFREALRVTHARVRNGAVELGFNRTLPLPAKRLIHLEPAVPFQVHRTYRGLRLVGEFAPGSTLSVRLDAGFPGRGRAVLKHDARRSVLVPEARPSLSFGQRGSVLSAKARPELEIRGTNVAEFGFSIRRLYANNAVHLAAGGDDDTVYGPARTETFRVGAARNVQWTERVDLAELLGQEPAGIYRVGIWDPAQHARPRVRVLQVTDLGVTFRAAPDAVAVHVRSLATGKPVLGAEVQVVTPTNQGLVFGTTDERGIVVLPFRAVAKDRVPFLVQVRTERDRAFVDLKRHAVELTDGTLSGDGREYLASGFEAWVRPSRGIFRPGERFDATVVVRDRLGVAPAGEKLVAAFLAPGGREWARQRFELSGAGLAEIVRELPDTARTGRWQLVVRRQADDVVLGRARFAVQAFVPNRLEAEVAVLQPPRIGVPMKVRVRGRWLDGAPAARRPVTLRVRLDHDVFRPEAFRGFSFGRTRPPTPPGELGPLRAQLDAKGEVTFSVELPPTAAAQVLRARITAEVQDPSGRPVFESTAVRVLRPKFHFGIRADAKGAEIVAVDARGEVVDDLGPDDLGPVALALEWRRYEWKTERHRGGYRYRTEVVAEEVAKREVELAEGRVRVARKGPMPDRRGGWFVYVVRGHGLVAEAACTTRPARPDRLRVVGPRIPVVPGQIARLHVEAPADGQGFLTIEGHGIHAARVVAVVKGHNEIDVSIPAGMDLPNVHAVLTFTRGIARKGDAGPFWLVGGASIALHHAARSSTVALEGPAEVRPASQVDFAIHAPGAAKATVALVDEGVLNLTRHTDPDPLAFFAARRRLDSRGADHGGFLMTRVRFQPGVQTGGDGGSGLSPSVLAGSVSSRIRPVALFRTVDLDSAGRASVRFTLPEYEGRLRAMVVAAGPRVVGAAGRSLVVKAPLSVQIAMPRMLAPGDETVVPVTVKNNTGRAGTVQLEITAEGGLRTAGKALPGELRLAAGEVRTIDVACGVDPAATSGTPRLRVAGRLGAHRRSVAAETLVRAPTVFVRDEFGLRLEGEQEVELGSWSGSEVEVRLRVDERPDAQLRGALSSLLAYPYGCLEQTTSRAMGLLACRSMLPHMLGADAPQVLPMLQAGVDRIFSMQTRGGAFAWWPGQSKAYSFGTVHALDFLLEAKALGAEVPEDALRSAVDALARIVRQGDHVSLRCHAIEVLSRAGRPVQPWLDFLAASAVLADDRARVAMALARHGQKARALAMLEHQEQEVERSSRPLLRSRVRDRALQLRARLELGAVDDATLSHARFLGRVMARPKKFNTQEKAQGLRALAEYYRVVRTARGGVRAQVVVKHGDQEWKLGAKRELTVRVDPAQSLRIVTRGHAFASLEVSGHRSADEDLRSAAVDLSFVLRDVETGEPVERFRRGRAYEVCVRCHAKDGLENFLLTQLLPGGFEPEPPRPHHSRPLSRIPHHVERRDDRVLVFVPGRVSGEVEFRYLVRAVFPGRYAAPPLRLEAMYEPELRASTRPAPAVEIVP